MANAVDWHDKFYQPLEYDPTNEQSVITFAGLLIQQRLGDKLQFWPLAKANGKGQFGNVLEEFYFHKKLDSISEPDFPCGLELKSAPLRPLRIDGLSVKERVSLSMINYLNLPKESFASSTFLKKNSRILLVFYVYKKDQLPTDALVEAVYCWRIPPEDLPVIEADWNLIHTTVAENRATELSEGQTRYIGACTKGAGGGQVRLQSNQAEAKPRAFSLKRSYVQYIYKRFVLDETTSAPLIKAKGKKHKFFETVIQDAFRKYAGRTADQIAQELKIPNGTRAKHFNALVTKYLFKIPPQLDIEEFEKAGIVTKTIRVQRNGRPKEHISFPYFDPLELVGEDWEHSTPKNQFSSRFFFVIYVEDQPGVFRLDSTQFWAMPNSDIECAVKLVWAESIKRLKSKRRISMPGQKFNSVAHVRPHGRNKKDRLRTPHGWYLTKPCFWLDARYISDQLNLKTLTSKKTDFE